MKNCSIELDGEIPSLYKTNGEDGRHIAIATNLLRRQDLTIIERGKAYKALLDARNRHGFRTDLTSGESRQKYSARGIVAEFFGVTEYEIRKAVKLAQLIPPLAEIVENEPKKLNLACADLIADYDESAQTAFIEMCQIDGYALNKQTMAFMKVRKFRILRLRHHVSMVELGRACGVSAQRISELELSENKPSAETVQKIQSGFESIIAQRGEKLGLLRRDYDSCKNSLMERVGEYEYEL